MGYIWWRHQMETFSAVLALCAGNSPVPVNSPHKGQWRGALMLSLIYAWINDWVNNREAGDLRRQRGHCDVIVMSIINLPVDTLIMEMQDNTVSRSHTGTCDLCRYISSPPQKCGLLQGSCLGLELQSVSPRDRTQFEITLAFMIHIYQSFHNFSTEP